MTVQDAPSPPPARGIPVSVAESFRSWWAVGAKESAASEQRLLRKLPFFLPPGTPTPTPAPALTARTSHVALPTPGHYINTLALLPSSPAPTSNTPPVVLLHGYGAGLGFFFRNLPALGAWAAARQTRLYALDWLGMGRSARVPFRVRAPHTDTARRVREAEGFFVESLEAWRAAAGLERVTLVGHSLGAYLSVAYALRYPARVERLVLLSPAGVPRGPEGVPGREMDAAPAGAGQAGGAEEAAAGGEAVRRVRAEQRVERRKESRVRRLATHLWEEGWSPFQVVRSTLFFGPMLVGKYSARRFSGLTEEETRDMHDYILNITLAKGSGEYCISHILAPGAHARRPLVDRIAPITVPVTFVYGEHDWMDPRGGEEAVENLRAAGNRQGRMYIIPGAGHHVYLDNPDAVNELLVKELERTVRE